MTTKLPLLPDLDPSRLPVLIDLARHGGWHADPETIKEDASAFIDAVKVTIDAINRETSVLRQALEKAKARRHN